MLSTNAFSVFELIIKLSVALSLLMTVSLLVGLLLVRSRNAFYRRRQLMLTTRWRGIFKTAYTGGPLPETLPRIGKLDWFTVIALFVQFHDVREKDQPRIAEVSRKLDDLAARLGLADHALLLLQRGDDGDKILALEALGHIRDTRALERASELTQDAGAELSRAAAHCVLRIDPAFVGGLLQLILLRDDWVRSRVEVMLREIDPATLGLGMRDAMAGASEQAKPRLLDYVRFCPAPTAHLICSSVLAESLDPETLASALRSLAPLASARDHDIAVRFTNSLDDVVALSGLRVLRKCVRPDDRELLVKMLSNRDYWVRLRAAEAAVQLFDTVSRVDEFAAGLRDRYARDAIKQVLAERAMNARRAHRTDRRIQASIEAAA